MEGFLDCGNSSIKVWYLVFAPVVRFPVSDKTRINTHISSNISSNYAVLKGSDAASSFCTNSLHLKWWDRWWHPMFSSSTEANSSSNRNQLQSNYGNKGTLKKKQTSNKITKSGLAQIALPLLLPGSPISHLLDPCTIATGSTGRAIGDLVWVSSDKFPQIQGINRNAAKSNTQLTHHQTLS